MPGEPFPWKPFIENDTDLILKAVCYSWSVEISHLVDSKRSSHDIITPRYCAAWLIREITGMSYPKIAKALGWRDHSSAIGAVQRIDGRRALEPRLQSQLDTIVNGLESLRHEGAEGPPPDRPTV